MKGGRRWILLGLLAAVVVVNLAQFRSIDAVHGGVGYAALGRVASPDILTLARVKERIESTYGLYLDLRKASPRSHLVASSEGILNPGGLRDLALGIGDAASVEIVAFDDTVAPPVSELVTDGGVVTAEGTVAAGDRTDVPWQLVTGDCGATAGRELVIVRWGAGAELAIGLVESCLLPDGFAQAAP
jgi:hypothetical protein